MTNKSEPLIILWDLETMPDLREVMKVMPSMSDYPGQTLKASINSIICFGYKIFGEPTTRCLNAWDYKGWSKDVNDDYALCAAIQDRLKDADCIVTHNGNRFDLKFLQTRLLKHGLPTLPKIIHVDTCQVAKANLLMFRNSLNMLAKHLTTEEKMENGGWELWVKVMQRDQKAMKLMTDYCKQDVIATEAVFKRLRPFINKMPDYNIFNTIEKDLCPNCGSTRIKKGGFITTKTAVRQRLRCADCGTWSSIKKEGHSPKNI